MNAADIFSMYERAAQASHIVCVTSRTEDSIIAQLDCKNGRGMVRLYALFPDIFLGFNEFSCRSFPSYPSYQGEAAGGIKISFCVDGCCEVKMSDHRYLCLEAGDVSIDTRTAEDTYTFPYDRFYGIEVFIHDSALKQIAPDMFKAVGIDIAVIRERYCHDGQSFIAKAGNKVKSIFLNIAEPFPECALNYFRLQVTELFFLLEYMEKPTEDEHRSFFTAGQVHIAKQVMNIITRDLSVRHPIHKLAKDFCVSPTSLKNYFQGVYGQRISVYLRGKRMDKAVEYLKEGSLPIAEIALSIGYENASKFAAAFKLAKGESPLEYRRKHRASL
ncbi:MAG: AraC family transcriptional regulator [Treponema sp.]|jgi:AraC-like DNA-binding protein|nr:AraC family transcriptional regulator [Treponema sp.]